MPKLLRIWTIFAFTALAVYVGKSQTFTVSDVDASEFPTIKAGFMAIQADGKTYPNLNASQFFVSDNGVNVSNQITVDCKDTLIEPDVSIVLVLDQSTSMINEEDGEIRWNWVKQGVKSFLQTINLTDSSSIAMTSFGRLVYTRCPFTRDKQRIIDSLDVIQPYGATEYDPPFLDRTSGVVELLKKKNPEFRRIVVFLTDGEPNKPPNKQKIIDSLRQYNIQVYAITLAMPMNQDLKDISNLTGGGAYEVNTREELDNIYKYIAIDIQSKTYCDLIWEGLYGCDEASRHREVKIKFLPYEQQIDKVYTTPPNSVAEIWTSSDIVSFGDPPGGQSQLRTIRFSPENSPLRIGVLTDDIKVVPSGYYSIINYGGVQDGSVINVGDTIDVTVEFTQEDPKRYRQATLVIGGQPCPDNVTLVGGYEQVIVVNPEGGDLFSTCDEITIKWAGVEPNTAVKLSYRKDGGAWQVITNNAVGLSRNWTPPSAGNYEIKAEVSETASFMWLDASGGEGDDRATSLTLDNNDRYIYVCGSFEGDADFGDIQLKSYGSRDAFLAKYNTDGVCESVYKAGSPGVDSASGVCMDDVGNVYVVGTCIQGARFGTLNPSIYQDGTPYAFVAKYPGGNNTPSVDVTGATQMYTGFKAWAKKVRFKDGEIHVVMTYQGQLQNFNKNFQRADNPRTVIAVYGTDLVFKEIRSSGYNDPDFSKPSDSDGDGNQYTCGEFSGTITKGEHTKSSAGGKDAWVAKFGSSPGSEFYTDEFEVKSPVLEFATSSVTFPDCTLGSSVTGFFPDQLCNNGEIPIEIARAEILETPAEYSITSNLIGKIIEPGECVTIELEFIPDIMGTRTQTLEVEGVCAAPVQLTLIGEAICTGEPHELVDFGPVNISIPKNVNLECAIKNTNTGAVSVSPEIVGTNPGDFSMNPSGTALVEPGECFTTTVTFTPQGPGARSAEIKWNLPDGCEDIRTPLQGVGVDADIALIGVDWGGKRVETVNSGFAYVENFSSLPATITEIKLRNNLPQYVLGDYPALPYELPAGDTVRIPITFTPNGEQTYDDEVLVKIEAVDDELVGSLQGSGYLPKMNYVWTCGEPIRPGETNTATLEIRNPSTSAELYVQKIEFLSGTDDFSWTSNQPQDFYVGKESSAIFNVNFSPQFPGIRDVEIEIVADNKPGPDADTLQSTIAEEYCEGLGLSYERELPFGSTLICDEPEMRINLENNGDETSVRITGYSMTGLDASSGAFEVDWLGEIVVGPGATNRLDVKFLPTENRTYEATLLLPNNIGPDFEIELTGKGEFIKLTSNPAKIESQPGLSDKTTIVGSIPALEKGFVEDIKIKLTYDDKMIQYVEGSLENQMTGWIWNEPTIVSEGELDIDGTGILNTPFDGPMFELRFTIFLGDVNTSDIVFDPVHGDCETPEPLVVEAEMTGVCFATGRLVEINNPYSLSIPEPNPSDGAFSVEFSVGFESRTKIELVSAASGQTKILFDKNVDPGVYVLQTGVKELSSGVYYVRMTSGHVVKTQRLIIAK